MKYKVNCCFQSSVVVAFEMGVYSRVRLIGVFVFILLLRGRSLAITNICKFDVFIGFID